MIKKMKGKRLLKIVLKLLFTALAFYLIFRVVDFKAVSLTLQKSNPLFVFLAFVVLCASQIVSAQRLRVILKAFGDTVPYWWNVQLYAVGITYNLALPGGVGGDGYKALVYSRLSGKKIKSYILPLLLDRLSGLFVIGLLLMVLLPFQSYLAPISVGILTTFAIPLCLFLGFLLIKKWLPTYKSIYGSVLGNASRIQVLQIGACILLAISLNLDLSQYQIIAFVFLVSSIATAIPVFMGGIGAREAVFSSMAVLTSANQEQYVAIGLLFSAITVLTAVFGLVFPVSESSLKAH
jgi:uncharacterized membrane protein YbhN (UPF0104 family)